MRSSKLMVILAGACMGCFAKPPKDDGGGGGGRGDAPPPAEPGRCPQLGERVLVFKRDGWINSNNTSKNFGARPGDVVAAWDKSNQANVKVILDEQNDHHGLNTTSYGSLIVYTPRTDAERKKLADTCEAWAEFVPDAE